ncbi:protein with unknown function [Ricinus communis]|uniref:DUF3444 domain-containing protein n=1 Tax=Ricinus communis TaxID=3988 RepID=B9S4Q7_RICCO|nr:protein with unknown function [Ricinus communis]
MECNKEEAFRAKELVEKKMQNEDYVAARQIVLKGVTDFIAHELFTPSGSTWNHFMNEKRVPNQGSSKAFPQNYAGKPSGMSFPYRFSESDPMPNVGKAANVGGNKPKEVKVENATGNGRGTIPYEKVNGHMDVKAENGGDLSAQNFGPSIGRQSRRSLRHLQHISYKENYNDDDDFFVPTSKRSRGNSSSNVNDVQAKAATADGRVPNKDVSAGSVASILNRNSKEVKHKASSDFEEIPSNNNRGSGAEVDEASMPERSGTKLENDDERLKTDTSDLDLKPTVFICTDPNFSNFDKERVDVSFAVNQVWAIYDHMMLRITWLESIVDSEAEQQWCDEGLPVGCGSYEYGETEETVDHLMFSHKMDCMSGGLRGIFCIYPKKGKTWALFKDWDAKWSLELEKHRPSYQFVEVLTDFTKDTGIRVAYLAKVKGFVSIFQQANCDEGLSFFILPRELYRFSHRVPSVKMSGKEGLGVPEGSFECDTASLPSNLVSTVDA